MVFDIVEQAHPTLQQPWLELVADEIAMLVEKGPLNCTNMTYRPQMYHQILMQWQCW
jgi:hypothetical protein